MLSFYYTSLWRKIRKFENQVYELINNNLQPEEKYCMDPQMRRAVTSIAFNYSEGYGRMGDKEFSHFLSIARGSAHEVDTQLTLGEDFGYFPPNQELHDLAERIIYELTLFMKKKERDYNHEGEDGEEGQPRLPRPPRKPPRPRPPRNDPQ